MEHLLIQCLLKLNFGILSNDHNQRVITNREFGLDLIGFYMEQNTETFHFITQDDDGSNYHNYDGFSPNLNEWV